MSTHDPASDPPGAVSDQNGEEAESGHRQDGTHPEPRTRGAKAGERENAQAHPSSEDSDGERSG